MKKKHSASARQHPPRERLTCPWLKCMRGGGARLRFAQGGFKLAITLGVMNTNNSVLREIC